MPLYQGDTYTTAHTEPLRAYTTTTGTWDNLTRDYDKGWRVTIDGVTKRDLEEFARKIYKIIEEHTPIDISEAEFMELLED